MPTRGFSMIEMLMVMAVFAILALIALPTLLDRNVRLQVQEALALADLAKAKVATFYADKKDMPSNNEDADVPSKEKIVSTLVTEVSIDAGAVTITFGNSVNSSIAGKHLTFRPAVVVGTPTTPIAWLCNTRPVPSSMTAMGVNRTDIPPKWLPIECRS
ncbi:MAG: pilin [Burkholderiales bacterium]|nr:pilin [Burkholderiales bacterium]